MTTQCPACGADVRFKSSVTVFAVCTYCASMLVRKDLSVESIGKMAQLPPDLTVFQVGAGGRFEKRPFQLIGRMRMGWSDGFWNEWYALFDDGHTGWLGEAQGQLMMSFEIEDPRWLPGKKELQPGRKVKLHDGETWDVDDIRDAKCVGSEGELPLTAEKGKVLFTADLSAAGGRYAGLAFAEGDSPRLYVGRYVDIDELQMSNLRQIDGW